MQSDAISPLNIQPKGLKTVLDYLVSIHILLALTSTLNKRKRNVPHMVENGLQKIVVNS